MLLQVDNEFQEVRKKYLNDEKNVERFTSSVKGGKAFAAEQKKRELKIRIAKLNALKMKVTSAKIITTSSEIINTVLNEKYWLSPDEIEKKSLSSKRFRTLFNFHRIEWTNNLHDRQKNYTTDWIGTIRKNSKRNKEKKKKAARKKVLVLVERIQKKSAPRKFYKQSVQNIAYFNKEQTYVTKNKTKNR